MIKIKKASKFSLENLLAFKWLKSYSTVPKGCSFALAIRLL